MKLKSLILAGALLAGASVWAGDHYVFAHFMVCLPYNGDDSVAAYEHQIRLAQQYGIDGFALNCGAWTNEPYYVERSKRMYEAAKRVTPDFKIFFSIDTASGLDPLPAALDMMKRFADHPNQFRHDGKPVLSAYSCADLALKADKKVGRGLAEGQKSRWAETLSALKDAGNESCFVPFFWTDNYTLCPSYDGILNTFADAPYLDGYFLFGIDAPVWDLIQGNSNCRRASDKLGKIYMATNSFAYNSANVRDFHGMRDYSAIWEGFIKDNADWVEIVTWNDYTEDGHLSPAHAGTKIETERINHDESYLDVTAYYSAWFKSGRQPEIKQERIFYVYRERSKWLDKVFDSKTQAWVLSPDQIHDDVEDKIYSSTFLKEPAELTIQTGKDKKSFQLKAGVSHVEIPFQPGVPHFTLKRQGKVIADFSGRQEIIKEATKENSPAVWRNSNRTWTGTWCLGEAISISAEKAVVIGDAKIVDVDGRKAVSISQNKGSGIQLLKDKVPAGPLNFRIRYKNQGALLCRLTMSSGATPAFIYPVYLPPTQDAWTTVSFLWTPPLPADAGLRIEHKEGDVGEALIESVEIVRSEPVPMAKLEKSPLAPAMVELPGGSFSMGSAEGAPDEAPVHKVTLSPFRLGKFEVTNAEYERFKPQHRHYRDEYSWRDSDPVIYVSWQQAAQYCNWLSAQAGLPPAYDEKTWVVNLTAGYRLPTEAEWEYAASGRGEGRIYPWGKEAPDKTRCNADSNGTVAVGSYHAGASRDGVMDMAGNVAEWCTEVFHPYPKDPVTDPCPLMPGAYRSIRGGSWGYYNKSQRVADREFNSQVYPGYYYIGFRIALPAAKK